MGHPTLHPCWMDHTNSEIVLDERFVHQDGVLMLLNRGEHDLVFVPEVSVRHAETIDKSLLAKHVLRDSSRGFGQRLSIALPKSVIETSLDQPMPNSASRKLFINRQHEQVQVLAGGNCSPLTELLIEVFPTWRGWVEISG